MSNFPVVRLISARGGKNVIAPRIVPDRKYNRPQSWQSGWTCIELTEQDIAKEFSKLRFCRSWQRSGDTQSACGRFTISKEGRNDITICDDRLGYGVIYYTGWGVGVYTIKQAKAFCQRLIQEQTICHFDANEICVSVGQSWFYPVPLKDAVSLGIYQLGEFNPLLRTSTELAGYSVKIEPPHFFSDNPDWDWVKSL